MAVQPRKQVRNVHRSRKGIALRQSASHAFQRQAVFGRFDSFGEAFQIKRFAQAHDRGHDLFDARLVQLAHEAAIDLDLVDGEPAEIAQNRSVFSSRSACNCLQCSQRA